MAGEVKIEGLAGFRQELRKPESDTNWNLELTRGMRSIAQKAAAWSQDEATAMGGQQAHFAGALFGRATASQARIEVAGPRSPKGKVRANPAFWGRNSQGNWIGASWQVGVSGEGPYAINETIARRYVEIEARMRRLIDDLAGRAFPDGGS